jgi:hypothetical protein
VCVAMLAVAGAASGVGPWPGLARTVVAPSGDLRYTATRAHGSTTVKAIRVGRGKVVATKTFAGLYGIPAVTSTGVAGGLSPDERLLVLGEPTDFQSLRARSRFLVLATGTLALRGTIVLRGEFGFDALSPSGRTLYLIQHASPAELSSYVVRAYDVTDRRLLRKAIVDKREAGETMRGYPVARASSERGAWVYTLYHRGDDRPFIHALDTVKRAAVCIDLPWQGQLDGVWDARLELSADGRELRVRSASGAAVATVDTKTLRML